MLMRVFGNHKVCRNCLRRLRTLNKSFQREGSSHSWRSASVRSTFLDFFCGKHEHLFVPSSSIIAKKGEGSYFTNAGMNQVNIYFALILKSLYLLFKLWRCLLYISQQINVGFFLNSKWAILLRFVVASSIYKLNLITPTDNSSQRASISSFINVTL